MKKLLMLIIFAIVPTGMMAQAWLNRSANDYRQRNQQRMIQHNNGQQTYLDRQRHEQQERTFQSRTVEQQRDNNKNSDKVVSLVVNGTGTTKEEATRNALRSAIEQAFGTFVSANTEILNDELIKDEIVTVTSGNIQSYEELSCSRKGNGLFDVSVKTVVSINKLVEFAQSKGAKTELAGSLFVNNIEIKEKNRENEDIALFNLRKQLMEICK
ncbi:MAG: hypothetical protein IKI06_09875 [Prevotella sp.]|nr:hypothetical protein [Prevotella sp.]